MRTLSAAQLAHRQHLESVDRDALTNSSSRTEVCSANGGQEEANPTGNTIGLHRTSKVESAKRRFAFPQVVVPNEAHKLERDMYSPDF